LNPAFGFHFFKNVGRVSDQPFLIITFSNDIECGAGHKPQNIAPVTKRIGLTISYVIEGIIFIRTRKDSASGRLKAIKMHWTIGRRMLAWKRRRHDTTLFRMLVHLGVPRNRGALRASGNSPLRMAHSPVIYETLRTSFSDCYDVPDLPFL